MWKTLAKWLILTGLLAYAVFAAAWAYSESTAKRCAGIEVEIVGTQCVDTLTAQGVVAELARYDHTLVGKPLQQINTGRMERFLNSMANFEDVQCVLTAQRKLRVCVTPMVPEMRVFDGNASYYINKDGKRINAKAAFFTDVPVAVGEFSKSFTPQELLPVARFIEHDPELRELITMIEARDRNNIMLIPRVNGHVINIGDTTDLLYKKRSIMMAYRHIMPYKGWETYDTICVKYHGQIVATRRDKSALFKQIPLTEETDAEEATLDGLTTTEN